MTREDVTVVIETAIGNIQEQSGDRMPDLRPGTVPIDGIPGFDSLRGLELAVAMTKYFDIPEGENICISKDGKRALTVDEIATRLLAKPQKSQDKDEE